jgi:hypothetical protein
MFLQGQKKKMDGEKEVRMKLMLNASSVRFGSLQTTAVKVGLDAKNV